MMMDVVSNFDHFSGVSFVVPLVYWVLSLLVLILILNGSSYWMAMNWTEAFVMGFLLFDPAKMRDSRAFSDPGYSVLVCSAWLVMGFTGFLSLCPYYDDLAREPAFIYSVTMVLWWYALMSYGMSSFRHFSYGLFLNAKSAVFFMFLLVLETVSWLTRGITFGARFIVSGMFGTGVSYALASQLSLSNSAAVPSESASEVAERSEEMCSDPNQVMEAQLDSALAGLADSQSQYDSFSELLEGSMEYDYLADVEEALSCLAEAASEFFSMIDYSYLGMVVLNFAWTFYEMAMLGFQCYLIGLLGICFCMSEPLAVSTGFIKDKDVVIKKHQSKRSQAFKAWDQFMSTT
uniref:ATP synthase F0 subunit 6 n=1 Tax=Hippopus porcellanus TaxID=80819 RepID=UPI00226CE346|nr:ATP synthase F0 subunit 6 [Hippopus porcellanus]UZM09090.1 ATP synthase F0 subunit 6 [Hippopus porcellanus]